MKIGISSTGNDASDMADPRFGRCEFFAIHDTKDGTYCFIENTAQSSAGGAGIAASQQLIDEDVEFILTGNMGPNAYNVIGDAGIGVYRIGSIPVQRAVALFKEAKLEPISEAGTAHSGMQQEGGGFNR